MITPKMCCDTKFPLINFAIKKILDLGLHLKLTITDKLFIFDRNHSLHCGKQTTLRSRRPGFRANKASNIDKLTFFLTVQDRMTEMQKTGFNLKSNQKKRSQFKCNMDSFTFLYPPSSQRFKIQNYLSVLSFEHLISFIIKKFRHFPIREMFSRGSWGKRLR